MVSREKKRKRAGGAMQTVLITFLFGTVCSMVLWAAGSAAVTRDELLQRYRYLSSEEA
jgi:hypothetical protein